MADGKITIGTKIDQLGAKHGIKDLEKKLNGTAKKAQKIGSSMTKYLTAPLVALGGMAFVAANEVDEAYRNIRVGTGATGDALDDLKESFDNVFSSVPDSADQVSNALATINTLTGATGNVLEGLTQNVLDASRTLGEDGVANSEAFGQALKMWQIPAEEGTGELDKLYKLTQDYGVGLGTISGQLTTYGSVLKNAGFEMGESAEFMASLESNGISVSRVMPGLNKAFRSWADEGKNSRKELDKVIDSIKNAETDTEALALATETFGAEGAQRMMTAIRNGAIPSLDELGNALENSEGLVGDTTEATRTIGEEFAILKNNTMQSLQPLGEILLSLAKDYIPPLVEAVQRVAEWFSNLSPTGQKVVIAILGIMAILPPLIMLAGSLALAVMGITWPVLAVIAGIAALIAIGVLLAANWETIKAMAVEIWTAVSDFFIGLFRGIKDTFNKALNWIDEITNGKFKILTDTIRDYWRTAFENLKEIWQFIKNTFKNSLDFLKALVTLDFQGMKDAIQKQMQNAKNLISTILGSIKGFFSRTWDRVLSGVEKFKSSFLGVWQSIKEGVRAVVNPLIGIINGLIGGLEFMINSVAGAVNGLPSFDIPSWVPGVGGNEFGLPNIPTIALPKLPSLDVGTNFIARDGLAMLHKGEKVVPAKHNGPFQKENDNKEPQVYIANMEVRDEEDIYKISRELHRLKLRSRKSKGLGVE